MTFGPAAQLEAERHGVDVYLTKLLCLQGANETSRVHEAMRYAVLGAAQRIRPILSLRVARMVAAPEDLALRLAASVELLHCASLVVDDLPCMDDSPSRRDKASVHVEFGEATAVLAAFGLVALAARSILEGSGGDAALRSRLIEFQLALLRSLDCSGLIAGQELDLRLDPSAKAPSDVVSELKTVPLFSLAVKAGALLADLNENQRALLSGFGRDFGLAFQMSDDILDGELSDPGPFEEKLSTLRATIQPFGATSQPLEHLIDYLHARVFATRAR